MTVAELIARLNEYPEDAKVVIIEQPNYPLEASIVGLVSDAEINQDEDSEYDEEAKNVYICAGSTYDYGKKRAYDLCG
jgi:hypothetical protein